MEVPSFVTILMLVPHKTYRRADFHVPRPRVRTEYLSIVGSLWSWASMAPGCSTSKLHYQGTCLTLHWHLANPIARFHHGHLDPNTSPVPRCIQLRAQWTSRRCRWARGCKHHHTGSPARGVDTLLPWANASGVYSWNMKPSI
jgi:hypothetical protein